MLHILGFYVMSYLKRQFRQQEHFTTISMCILTRIREDIFTATKCTKRRLKVGQTPVMLSVCK